MGALILTPGATGHAGGRLLPRLLEALQAAVSRSLNQLSRAQVVQLWKSSIVPVIITRHAGFLIDIRHINVEASPEDGTFLSLTAFFAQKVFLASFTGICHIYPPVGICGPN